MEMGNHNFNGVLTMISLVLEVEHIYILRLVQSSHI